MIIKMYSISLLLILIVIGVSITKNWKCSIFIGLFLTAIYSNILDNKKTTILEGMSNKKQSKKSNNSKNSKKSKIKKLLKKKKFPKGKYTFNPKKTYIETYKSMDKKQMKGLKKDTKDLIDTQNKLMSTLKEMGPVLQQGKNIIGAFDSYFGDQKTTDLTTLAKQLNKKN